MPARYRGATPIVARYRGATPILNRYRGTTLVWSSSGGRGDDFNRPDAITLGSNWTDLGPSADRKLGVEGGRARLITPDGGLGGIWDYRTSSARYNVATNTIDNGFVECRPATLGDPAGILTPQYFSEVYGRGNNTGSTHTHGVGISMAGGHCWLVSQIAGANALRADGGTFQPGSILRHIFVGNLHNLYVDGQLRGTWNDSGGLAASGSSWRSLIIRGDASKDFLGPRRFSPALDYVLMG